MKKLLVSLMLLAASFGGYKLHYNMVMSNAHKSAHFIKLDNVPVIMLIFSSAHGYHTCSSVSIGPHALMTAAHCDGQGDDFQVDDKPAHIDERIFDGYDHMILLVSKMTFSNYVKLAPAFLNQRDEFFMFGNPKEQRDLFRKGYVMGVSNDEDGDLAILDLNGFFGDSGSGLFNSSGEIYSVLSKIHTLTIEKGDPNIMKEMGAYDFKFRPDEVERAYNY